MGISNPQTHAVVEDSVCSAFEKATVTHVLVTI